MCRLSRRQRTLYDDFLGARSTRDSMSSGSFIAIMNVLMQLRKVCNHPDLFEGRPIISACDVPPLWLGVPRLVANATLEWQGQADEWLAAGLMPVWLEDRGAYAERRTADLAAPVLEPAAAAGAAAAKLQAAAAAAAAVAGISEVTAAALREALTADVQRRIAAAAAAAVRNSRVSALRGAQNRPLLGVDVRCAVHVDVRARDANMPGSCATAALTAAVLTAAERLVAVEDIVRAFTCVVPAVRARPVEVSRPTAAMALTAAAAAAGVLQQARRLCAPFHAAIVRQKLYFPDRRLIQFDCGSPSPPTPSKHILSASYSASVKHRSTSPRQVCEAIDRCDGIPPGTRQRRTQP